MRDQRDSLPAAWKTATVMNQKPKIRAVTTVAEGRLFRLEGVDLEFSNGKTAVFERVMNTAAAVMVVPILDDGLCMVHEYANGTDRYELGFVKGTIDEGETPQQAALRELKEEVGLGANRIQYIRQMHGIPHYSNFEMHLFFAWDCYPVELAEDEMGDEIEPLIKSTWRFDQIRELANHSEINDPRVLTALWFVEKWLDNKKCK